MRKLYLPLHLLLGFIVMACGALEAWFGRPELLGDDISYLDVANMIRLGDWRAAFNPLWSIGYPLLIVLVRPFFPAGIHGGFTAVFALNIAICLATWLSFLWFLKAAADFIDTNLSPLIFTVAACIFVVVEVGLGKVSSVGPDQLVVCLFFLACGRLLRFSQQPTVANGIRLGAILGCGFIVKAVFLPLSVMFLASALLPFRRRLPRKAALSVSGGVLLFLLPYAAALSWAIGRPTLGESGQLDYAYHVNQLPHWMGWQGSAGNSRLGAPLHPVHLLRDHPAVFGFGEPFRVTYPPQFNLHYWYDGYGHFFSPINALRAVAASLHELEKVLHENWPFTLALALALALLVYGGSFAHPSGPLRWVGSKPLPIWPLYFPALFGLALYIQVHLEGRYIAAFVAILAITPFLLVESPRRKTAILILLVAGSAADLSLQLRPAVFRAMRHADMQRGGQWDIASYLTQSGLEPGDKVASVTTLNDIRCTWAYAAGLRIVANIGNDAYSPQNQQQDFQLFWTDPATQQDVLRLFREQGAVAVIVPTAPTAPTSAISANWQQIPSTDTWILRL